MPLLFDKILGLFFLPLGITIFFAIAALAALALRRRGLGTGLLAFALAWLWIWSTPFTAHALIELFRAPYPPQHIDDLPAADAIVLLGGGVSPVSGDMIYPDMNGAADRVWHAARLYKAGKAPLIIASAGRIWGKQRKRDPNRQSPADAMRILLKEFGVPDASIIEEGSSRSTRQNALFTSEMAAGLEVRKVLLVTSYWHMDRALSAFERTGLEVIPAPSDHSGWGRKAQPTILWALPNAGALNNSSGYFREFLGYLAYRLRGWA